MAAALVLALTGPSSAMTVLCVGAAATGFNWRDGVWVKANYLPGQYLIQDVSDDPELSGSCKPAPITTSEWGTKTSSRCFNSAEMGEERYSFHTTACRVFHNTADESIESVGCESLFGNYTFAPNGEFVRTQVYADPHEVTQPDRDSLAITVGKCSVVAQ